MAATRSSNPAVAKKQTAKAKEIALANTSKKRKNDGAGNQPSAASMKKSAAKSKAMVSGASSRKRKAVDDDNEPPTPSAKKARTLQKASSTKAKQPAAKPAAKSRAMKSGAAKTKTTNTKATVPKATSRKRKSAEDVETEIDDPQDGPSVKKARTAQKAPLPKAKKPATKPRVQKPKAPKPKVVINTTPTQRLHVYVFGEGSSSELGLGTAKTAIDVKRPRLNPLLSATDVGVVHLACGGMHVAALTYDNKILTWGVNDQGALGRDTTWEGVLKDMDDDKSEKSDESDSGLNPLESSPAAVPASSFSEGTKFVQLSAGDSHTLALTDDGLVYGWGCFRVSSF